VHAWELGGTEHRLCNSFFARNISSPYALPALSLWRLKNHSNSIGPCPTELDMHYIGQ